MKNLPIPEHTEGELDSAEKKYLELKNLLPANNEVNFWLGYLYFQKNDFISAQKTIEEFLKVNNNIKAWNLLGLIYQNMKQFEKAKEAYQTAISLNPKYLDSQFNLGVLLTENNFFDEAIEIFTLINEENSEDCEPYFLLGYCYQQKKNYNLAIHFYSTSQSLNCNKAELYANCANIFCEISQFDKAIEYINDGLNLYPENEDLLIALAFYYEKTSDFQNQESVLLKLTESGTANYIPFFRLANLYKTIWQLDKAELYYKKALSLSPENEDVLLNYGVLCHALGNFENAVELFKVVLKKMPNNLSALNNLANSLLDLEKFDEAKNVYQIIFNNYPNSSLEHFNFGLALLLNGNYEEGFKHYEWRLLLNEYKREIAGKIRWNGENLYNKTLFVYGEQGIGDIIMFSRFLPQIKEKYNCKIIFECRKEIINLIILNFPEISVIERGSNININSFDYYCSLLSLPLLLKIKNTNDINPNPYLKADINKEAKWQNYFSTFNKLKVGIVWKGNPFPLEHRKRHTELKYFFEIAKINEIQLFSLQFGENCKAELDMHNIIELAYNFDETAAIIKNLDLIITVDTSIAHLAGALGTKTWVLLTKIPDWRWLLKDNSSYWYYSILLFRQKEFNNWNSVFDDVKSSLIKLITTSSENIELNYQILKEKAFNLLEENKLNESIEIYKLLTINFPNDIESFIWLGVAYYNFGNYKSAISNFKKVLETLGSLPEQIYNYYCTSFLNLGQYDEGIKETKNAIEIYENSAELNNTYGLLLAANNKKDEALNYFYKTLKLNNYFLPAMVNIANTYQDLKQFNKAIDYSKEALKNHPDILQFNQIIGNCYLNINKPDESIKYFKLIAEKSEDPKLCNNYGIALQRIHNYHLANHYFLKALNLENDNYGYLGNLGNNYALTHNFEKALECFNKGLEIAPGNKDLISMVGLIKLLTEDFNKGWQLFEYSLTKNVPFANIPDCKEYNGENLTGKTILIYSEHGLGDTLQFIRYIPLLKEKGCNIIFEFQKELAPLLFYTNGYYKPLIKNNFDLKDVKSDYYISLLKLPRIFCTNIANIPKLAPIIKLNEALVFKYKSMLNVKKKKIGLVWAGNPIHPNDHNRSIPFAYLKVLFNSPDTHFYLLQKENKLLLEEYNVYNNITDLSAELTTLENTAAIIFSLDIIVTVDTMVAHLAGTLNKPTYLLLPFLPDWRWLLNREDSVWYNSIKIFRQINPGDWSFPVEKIYKELNDNKETRLLEQQIKLLVNSGKYGKAIELLKDDLTKPGNKVNLLSEIALVFINLKEFDTAISILETALKLDDKNFEIIYNLGYCYHLLNNFEKASFYYKETLNLNPININALNNLGLIERDFGNINCAEKLFTKAISICFNKPFLHNNLGTINESCGNNALAIENFNTALSIDPNNVDALINLSNVYHYTNKPETSLEIIDKAVKLSPNNPTVRFNRALLLLRIGKLKEGFEEYEYRAKRIDYPNYSFRKPRLTSLEEIKGKTILVYDEQGYGDTIQFCRYIKNLNSLGCEVKLLCHPPLVDLMKGCLGISQVIGRTNLGDSDIEYDYYIPLLSLGMFFESRLEEIKVNVPYILVDHNLQEKWANDLIKTGRLRVGIVWKGKQTPGNTHRTCKLENFVPLFNNKADFYSLQFDLQDEYQIEILKKYNVQNLGNKIKTFNDTAAIISLLDLVISIDTSVAHLSCALGKQTWILLSSKCDWRWHDFRSDSPWYPTATLFRQIEFNKWNTVFAEADKKLKELINN